jgi:acyl-coenzyme A thioesterase PaaI-like protein
MLNRELLPDNTCFGCGHDNTHGLRIEIVRDPDAEDRLRALFTPTTAMEGFPGIVHGGAIYTALDCLSTWVATLLGPNREAGWILRSASTTYHKPASAGETLTLTGWITERGGAWDPLNVRTEARRPDGVRCVETDFKVVPLPQEKLVQIAGLEELPANWKVFLSSAG